MMKKPKKSNLQKTKETRASQATVSSLAAFVLPVIVGVSLLTGCQPNQTVLKDVASPTPMETVEAKKTTFEEDLSEMRTANFGFIFVFRRKDGGVFDKEDQKFLRDNTPPETNRWRRSDDGKAFIAGSGFVFMPEQLAALRTRFNVEDYSSPAAKEAANKAFSAPAANALTNAPAAANNNPNANTAANGGR